MKKIVVLIIAFVVIFFCSWKKETQKLHGPSIRTDSIYSRNYSADTIKGDFNGDNKQETAWIETTKYDDNKVCLENCHCFIKFSDDALKPIDMLVSCMKGGLWNEGDLNGDGADDLSAVVYGETDWSFCCLYSFKKFKWIELVEAFAIWGGVDADDIIKDSTKNGYVIIRELTAKDSICVESRSVKMNKF